MDRRAFVKTCVGVAGGVTLGAAGLSMATASFSPRPPPGPVVPYFGAHKVDGPAPRGVPYVPVTVEGGVFVGKTRLGETNVLDWYKYCNHAAAPGLDPDAADDNVLRYHLAEDKLLTLTPWYKALLGEPMRPEHFPAPGFGAPFVWRSEGRSGGDLLTGLLLRVDPDAIRQPETLRRPARRLDDDEMALVRREVFHGGFVAVSTFCTHFCCLPAWREDERTRAKGGWDRVYCACHGSAYEPTEPVSYQLAPEAVSGAPKRG